MSRTCIDCGTPADWVLLDEHGTFAGYLCIACDHKRRRDPTGWRDRALRWIHRRFGI